MSYAAMGGFNRDASKSLSSRVRRLTAPTSSPDLDPNL